MKYIAVLLALTALAGCASVRTAEPPVFPEHDTWWR